VDQWQALVKTVKNLRFHTIFQKSSVGEQLVASKEGPVSIELVVCLFVR
jgi:hypothetical protein